MQEHTHGASRRRDDGLARIRKMTVWITGSAAAASLGLGAAFAYELPGHTSAASSNAGISSTGGSTTTGSAQPTGGGAGQSGSRVSGSRATGGGRHQHALAKPTQAPQQPAINPAPPPVVSSGGS